MTPARAPRSPLVSLGEIDLHVSDMTCTVAGDVSLAKLQNALAGVGQFLPIDGDPALPLGTLMLRNSTGPLRLGYGAWRDILLGTQIRDGGGNLITAGARVIKNVAGYDLTKFIAGSHGMFGSVVTLTLRTWIMPAGALHVHLSPLAANLSPLLGSDLRPQYAMLTPQSLLLGYLGDEAALDFYAKRTQVLVPDRVEKLSLADDFAYRARTWASKQRWRASVAPGELDKFVQRLRGTWAADASFGIVVGDQVDDAEGLTMRAQNAGGWIMVYDDAQMPLSLPVDAASATILKTLKSSFDPNGTLPRLPIR
jgi:hypothetical protein